ncbi:MAG: flagellar hook-length control protein FliK [Rubrivivax sp.]|nr:flagellar hook-length control protein FliK [Rubrivivax sp.]
MLNLAPAVTAAPSTPAPGPQAPTPASPPGSFARQLNQAAATPTPTPTPSKPSTALARAESDAAAKRSDTPATAEGKTAAAEVEPSVEANPPHDTADRQAATADDTDGLPADPATWLAGLLAQAGAPAAQPTDAPPRATNTRAKGTAADIRAASSDALMHDTRVTSSEPEARSEGFAALLGAAPAASAGAEALPTPSPTLALAAATAPGHAAATVTGVAAGALPVDARVDARVDSPDFAAALGTQLSVLVKDGVQHARLHLNPAALGPISVQIALDGQTAQVHMVAEQALTRQALEQAMPALASALRESGLTLTGGGVFEQPRDPGQQQAQDGPGHNLAADAEPVAVALPSVRAPRGVLDVFA